MSKRLLYREYDEDKLIKLECSKCGEIKSVDNFYKSNHCTDGINPTCKKCSREKEKKRYLINKEKRLEKQRIYNENNKEKISEYRRQHYQENKEKILEYQHQHYQENKEKILEKHLRYYETNKEKISERNRQYHENNKEKINEKHAIYRKNNKEKIKESSRLYRINNKEKIEQSSRLYRMTNKEKISEYQRQYHENNKEKINERRHQYYQENKEKISERHRQYNENNKEKISEYHRQYNENNKEKISEYQKNFYNDKVNQAMIEIYENFTKNNYPNKDIQYGIIYGVHCKVTDRWYIGQTRKTFDIRYKGDFFNCKNRELSEDSNKGQLLQDDIEKYGQENFEIFEVIDVAFSEKELDEKEVYYIDYYKSYDEGYNSNRGNIFKHNKSKRKEVI